MTAMEPIDTPPYPSLLRRLTAMLYDSLLLLALVGVTNAIGLGVAYQVSGGSQETLGPITVRLLTFASIAGFFCLFWRKQGQTLGMQAWRIKLVSDNGGDVSYARGLLRCCAAILSAACLGMGYWWCLIDKEKRYWHCRLSGTHLVLLPKESRSSEPPGQETPTA